MRYVPGIGVRTLSINASKVAVLVAIVSTHSGAGAQESFVAPISPVEIQEDVAGLNLTTGKTTRNVPVVSIPAAPRLRFDRIQNAAPRAKGELDESFLDGVETRGDWTVHTADGTSEAFECVLDVEGFWCNSKNGTGSGFVRSGRSYTQKGSGARYNFGVTHLFSNPAQTDPYPKWRRVFYASSVTYPDGEVISYQYGSAALPGDPYGRNFVRPVRLSSNLGYHMTVSYQGNVLGEAGWGSPAQVTIFADSEPTVPLAQMTYNSDGTAVDLGGRMYQGVNGGSLGTNTEEGEFAIVLPGEASPSVTVSKASFSNTHPLVAQITRDGVSYNYSYTSPSFNVSTQFWVYSKVSVTGPASYSSSYDIEFLGNQRDGYINRVRSHTDANGRTAQYTYEYQDSGFRFQLPFARLTGVSYPEGNGVTIEYDPAGNLRKKTSRAKPGSGLPNLVAEAFFDLSGIPTINEIPQCNQRVMCWRPTWVRDASGNQTDFVYNDSGQISSILAPPNAQGQRVRTIIEYTATVVRRKAVERLCIDGVTCGTNSEDRTEYSYFGNTFLPSATRQVDLVSGQVLETTFTYDNAGRLLSQDGPLPGSDDAVYMRYDVIGRKTWEIGPKGANGIRNAKRFHYRDSDDQVVKVENGTISDPLAQQLTFQTLLDETVTAYNARRQPVEQRVVSGGTTYSLTQTSYDALNRPECVAVRMNTAAYGSLPANACTLGTPGANGPDRITRTVYDAAGQVLQVRKAVGTPIEIADVTYSYSPNGKIRQVIDANGNRAELRYDGHERQSRWVFPSKTRPGSFNPATPATALASAGALNEGDYEEYSYDANGNRQWLRKRDGRRIAFTYDALNRVTAKDVCAPGGAACTGLAASYTRDVFYEYDLRGLQTKARFDSLSGPGISYAYDAFGRLTSETSDIGGLATVVGSLYDAGSNRTRVTYPDGQFFTLDVDAAKRVTGLRDGTTQIGSMSYSNRGLPTQLAWTNLTASANARTYGYDPIGRLSSIGFDLNGTAGDVTWSYTRNPASQILTDSQSNDSYSWDGHVNLTRAYTTNGLNQYVSAGSASFCYDANGNLTADGSSVYLYDAENRLVEKRTQGTGNTNCAALSYAGALQAQLLYDPTGRLYQVSGGTSGIQRFAYDGNAIIAEYNDSGTMLRRYLHGSNAEADDPLIWYEGATQTSTLRRYLHSDPRGSIVAVTDHTGNRIAVNSYDEYGIPDTATGYDIATKGRFRYTGQAWIPELGMYYYKARIYSPTLGRFLQTDLIGYEDQFNLYAYVGNDPVNSTDPTGMYECNGTKGQCQDLKTYAKNLKDAAAKPITGSRFGDAKLRAADAKLGTLGDGGVKVTFNAEAGAETMGSFAANTINLDYVKINTVGDRIAEGSGLTPRKARGLVGGAVLAHEAYHAAFPLGRASNAFSLGHNQYRNEYQAYGAEQAYYRAWGHSAAFGESDLSRRAYKSCLEGALNQRNSNDARQYEAGCMSGR